MTNKVTALGLGILFFAVAVVSLAAVYSHMTAPERQAVDGTIIGVLETGRFKTRMLCRYKVGERTYVCPVMVERDKDKTPAKKGDHLVLYCCADSPADISLSPNRKDGALPVLYGMGAALGLVGSVWFFKTARRKQLS